MTESLVAPGWVQLPVTTGAAASHLHQLMIGMQTVFVSNAIQNPVQKEQIPLQRCIKSKNAGIVSCGAGSGWHPPVCSYSERDPSFHSIHPLKINGIGKHFSISSEFKWQDVSDWICKLDISLFVTSPKCFVTSIRKWILTRGPLMSGWHISLRAPTIELMRLLWRGHGHDVTIGGGRGAQEVREVQHGQQCTHWRKGYLSLLSCHSRYWCSH